MSGWRLPDSASLTDWCTCYRFAGLDVTIRGGEFVGLWIGEHIVAVTVSEATGSAILEECPTPTLARVERDGLILLASRDTSVAEVDVLGLSIISRPFVFRLPTGHPADPYLWRLTPDVALMPLSGVLAAERMHRARRSELGASRRR